ncbi:FAD-dependent oxidoreductase [Marinicella rhabdoformis]|uniref:FAD-dependent oxidoreductase n=1 Tax=Marinicella rhabdoformis TaxID=2580566 RepID=UPI0012AEB235|nr:FAD-dependent oxidoreductase [Marinicella rhabdoformis]
MAEPENDIWFDFAIVGGGMVGMGCALAMAQAGLSVLLLEAQAEDAFAVSAASFDDRTLVVNPASMSFWRDLGIWQKLEDQVVPIEYVHVSNQGHFGVVNFSASSFGLSELGAVVGAKDLAQVLWQAVNAHESITTKTSAQLNNFETNQNGVQLSVQHNNQALTFNAAVMVAADGARSAVREQLSLTSEVKSYKRTALVCNVLFDKRHQGCAFERLTQSGPLALLPFHQGRCGLVWSVESDQAQQLLELDEQDFISALQQQLSFRMGRLTQLGRRSSYPIYQVKVPNQIAQSVVLMGNAAHAVSPVSAQGLNLAVRGIRRLVNIMGEAHLKGQCLSDMKLLMRYQSDSEEDQKATLNYTDDLMTWFQINSPLVNGMRSVGLLTADAVPAIKNYLFERAGGLKT